MNEDGFRSAEVEVPGTPEQVWEAIATGEGSAGWLFPAEVEGRENGVIAIHRGLGAGTAEATITAWDPPRRFAYAEPLPGVPRPLTTELVVQARAGGTCVVRVVSGFTEGGSDGWEDLLDSTMQGWRMALRVLRAYLANFAGQPARLFHVAASSARPAKDRDEVMAEVLADLGLSGLAIGDSFRTPDHAPPLAGVVEDVRSSPADVSTAPMPKHMCPRNNRCGTGGFRTGPRFGDDRRSAHVVGEQGRDHLRRRWRDRQRRGQDLRA